MDFRQRAHTALEEDEPGRALMVLVGGLRRDPEREDALDLLLFTYVHHIHQPGLEEELFRGLEFQPSRSELLRLVVDELEEGGKAKMAAAVNEMAARKGIEVAAPLVAVDDGDDSWSGADVDVDSSADIDVLVDHSEGENNEEPPPTKDVQTAASKPPPAEESKSSSGQEFERDSEGESNASLGRHAGDEGSSDDPPPAPDHDLDKSMPAQDREAAETTTRRVRWSALSTKWRILVIAGVSVMVVVVGSIGSVAWQHARDAQKIRAVDEAMTELDPLSADGTLEVIEQARAPTRGRDDELDERRSFVRSVVAFERDESIDESMLVEEPTSAWGLAALAFAAAQRQKWEEAMRFVHHLRRAHHDALATYFARGRICEARGQWSCAIGQYRRMQRHFPEFVGAYTGVMRVGARRYDESQWREGRDELSDIRPEHPYLAIEFGDPFEVSEPRFDEVDGLEGMGERDSFIEVSAYLDEVIRLVASGQWEEAARRCEDERDLKSDVFASVHVVCAMAAAGIRHIDRVVKRFHLAASRQGQTERFFRKLQILAPRLLSDLGRPDQGLAFAIPFDDVPVDETGIDGSDFEIESMDVERPDHFRRPSQPPDPGEAEAMLVRARVLVDLGATRRARKTLDPLKQLDETSQRAQFEWVWTHLVEGNRDRATNAINQVDDVSLRRSAQAYLAYLEGDFAETHQAIGAEQLRNDARIARVRALALMADGRGRKTHRTLEAFDGTLKALALIPVRQRALARAQTQRRERFDEPWGDETNIDMRIDRAGAALWTGRLDEAEQVLDEVLEVLSDHPEANWKMGLLHRVKGQESKARHHFRKAWRGDADSTDLLVEAGRLQLDAAHYQRARETFLRAMLRDRENVEAVRGLGRAYHRGDRARGRRDLVSLLDHYSGRAGEAPAHAELYRWIAVVHGVRDGDEEAYRFLKRARNVGGRLVVILVEKGTYYEAMEDWSAARDYYGQALRVDPTVPDIHLALARVAKAKGDRGAARDHVEQTLRLTSVGEVRDEARALEQSLKSESTGD